MVGPRPCATSPLTPITYLVTLHPGPWTDVQLSREEREKYATRVFDTSGSKHHTRTLLRRAWEELTASLKDGKAKHVE